MPGHLFFLLRWKCLTFLCYLLSAPKAWVLFLPTPLITIFLSPGRSSPNLQSNSLFNNSCHFCAFCVKIHLSFFSHLLVTCSQLSKMLIDSGWLCHHSVIKYLYRLICNLYLSLSSRLSNTNISLPNAHHIYRCHKSALDAFLQLFYFQRC